MRQVAVYWNKALAGVLTEENTKSYIFRYTDAWYIDNSKPSISLTLPKTQQTYRSHYLFPFFAHLLAEGVNRKLQSRLFKIDEKDDFGLLTATATYDTIGAVTVKPMAA